VCFNKQQLEAWSLESAPKLHRLPCSPHLLLYLWWPQLSVHLVSSVRAKSRRLASPSRHVMGPQAVSARRDHNGAHRLRAVKVIQSHHSGLLGFRLLAARPTAA